EIEWKVLMFDESQALKNPSTKSHKVVRELQANQVLALSGTPVENNIQDLWSIMRIINPGLLGSRKDFLRRYRKPLEDGNKETIERLRQLIYPFMLRRTKGQVAKDLPPKEEFSIPVTLSAAEEKFYKGLKETLRSEVESILASEEPFRAGIVILAALSKLRQAAIAPKLVGGPDKSSKLEMVFEKIQEGISEDHKILIFSQYVRVLKILEELLEKEYIGYAYLDGSVPNKKRKKIIKDFQENGEIKVFLISLKAGGVGINLTEADYVFLVDPWWNPAVEAQAIDRTHRIGQTRHVFAYKFISEGTVEEKILTLQEKKKELVRNIISEDTSMFKNLSPDQILGLFE
ncbi:MAG: DEAD/DEAH box helicase, partial [Spirochaetales bacterium]|nr:DEAD/DEAH box helicase [Spirochaetales bacterium]